MSEKLSIITRETLVPLTLAFSIAVGAWYLSNMNSRIMMNEKNIVEIKGICTTNPSRLEFVQMQSDITEIKQDIKKIISK